MRGLFDALVRLGQATIGLAVATAAVGAVMFGPWYVVRQMGWLEEEPREPTPAELEDARRFEAFMVLEELLEPDVLQQQEILWQWWDAEPDLDAPPATWTLGSPSIQQ